MVPLYGTPGMAATGRNPEWPGDRTEAATGSGRNLRRGIGLLV